MIQILIRMSTEANTNSQNQCFEAELKDPCMQHPESTLTLLDLQRGSLHCPKCLIFGSRPHSGAKFVQIQDKQALITLINQRQQQIASAQEEVHACVAEAEARKSRTIARMEARVYQQFRIAVRQLQDQRTGFVRACREQIENSFNLYGFAQYQGLMSTINEAKNNLANDMIRSLPKFEDLTNQIKKVCESAQLQLELATMQMDCISKSQNFLFTVQNSQQEPCPRHSHNDEQLLVEQLPTWPRLLSNIPYQPEQTSITFVSSSCLISQKDDHPRTTPLPSQEIRSRKYDELSTSRTAAKSEAQTDLSHSRISIKCEQPRTKNPGRNTLRLHKVSDADKIQASVFSVHAAGIGLTNADAKKVLAKVCRSFARVLDLSGNKLTNLFMRELSKEHLGKYLKTVDLSGNAIDPKQPQVLRKIEALKSSGLAFIF